MSNWSTRRRRGGGSPAPPPPPVTIVQVVHDVDEVYIWTFSAAITSPPSSTVEFQIEGDPALAVLAQGVDSLTLQHSTDVGPGGQWNLTGVPTGIAFAGGAQLAAPQSGIVV